MTASGWLVKEIIMVEIKQVFRAFSLLVLASVVTSAAAQEQRIGSMVIVEEAIEAPLIEIIAQDSSFSSVSVRQCDTCPRRIFKSTDDLEVELSDRSATKITDYEGRVGSGVVFYDPDTEVVTRVMYFEQRRGASQ